MKRYALIRGTAAIDRYLPDNYEILARGCVDPEFGGECIVIEGEDVAGWTLHEYVLPRLASGMHFGYEIDLSHPVMKIIPA